MRMVMAIACIIFLPYVLSAQEEKNINTMSRAELMALKCGLGQVKSQRVIDERAKGEFESFEDLRVRVNGVGPKTVEKLKAKGVTCEPTGKAE